jgi:hypothetical protein
MSAANDTDWRLASVTPDAGAGERLRELAPGTTEAEARRQALLLRGRSRLTPGAPGARPSRSVLLFSDE